jgi:hypothetical protein
MNATHTLQSLDNNIAKCVTTIQQTITDNDNVKQTLLMRSLRILKLGIKHRNLTRIMNHIENLGKVKSTQPRI